MSSWNFMMLKEKCATIVSGLRQNIMIRFVR